MFWRVKCYRIFIIFIKVQLPVYLSVCVFCLYLDNVLKHRLSDMEGMRLTNSCRTEGNCVCRKQGPVCCVLLHYPFSTVQEGPGCSEEERSYKRVAIVEEFFHIIYNVHVEMDGRGGKHAGQKRTYRAVSPLYLDVCVCVHPPWVHERE